MMTITSNLHFHLTVWLMDYVYISILFVYLMRFFFIPPAEYMKISLNTPIIYVCSVCSSPLSFQDFAVFADALLILLYASAD